MNEQLSQKIRVLSLFAILMVVYIHAYMFQVGEDTGAVTSDRSYNSFIQDFISQGLTRVAVPLFFATSGYLFFLGMKPTFRSFIDKYKKRFSSLFVPFILWSTFGVMVYFILQQLPQSQGFFQNRIISQLSFYQLVEAILVHPVSYQLWFLHDLIILVVLSPLLWLIIKYAAFSALGILLVLWFAPGGLVLLSEESLLFFCLGAWLAIQHNLASLNLKGKRSVVLLLWVLLVLGKTMLVYFGFNHTLLIMLLHKCCILFGLCAVWVSFDKLLECRPNLATMLSKAAPYSFFIYAFHEPLLTILKKGLLYLFPFSNGIANLSVYLLAPLLVIMVSIQLAVLLKKNVPHLYGLLTGNR